MTELLQVEIRYLGWDEFSPADLEEWIDTLNKAHRFLPPIQGSYRLATGQYIVYYETLYPYIREEMIAQGVGAEIRTRAVA